MAFIVSIFKVNWFFKVFLVMAASCLCPYWAIFGRHKYIRMDLDLITFYIIHIFLLSSSVGVIIFCVKLPFLS
jgi:hypothetical protein